MDPLKFFDDEVRARWIYNALNHPKGPIKIILVCYDDLDAAYYPCNLFNTEDVKKKVEEIAHPGSTITIIEIIVVENGNSYKLNQV